MRCFLKEVMPLDPQLTLFQIKRSLNHKGTPHDNAAREATFKTIKTEFISGRIFPNQHVLDLELFDYVNLFNNIRIHGSLDYLTPTEYKLRHL